MKSNIQHFIQNPIKYKKYNCKRNWMLCHQVSDCFRKSNTTAVSVLVESVINESLNT